MIKKVITVTSGKGGVGKTSFALNLALLFSKIRKTLLFDGDLGLGNVELLLGVQIQRNLENVLKGECTVFDIMFKYKNLSIISGGSGVAKIANLSDDERIMIIKKLLALENFDIVIIDTSPGIGKNVLQFLEVSTDIVVVTSPELPSVIDSYQLIKTLKMAYEHADDKSINIVINQANSKRHADERANVIMGNCEKFLGLGVNYLGFLNTHAAVKNAVRDQIPFVVKDIKCLPSSQLKTMLHGLIGGDVSPDLKNAIESNLETEVL